MASRPIQSTSRSPRKTASSSSIAAPSGTAKSRRSSIFRARPRSSIQRYICDQDWIANSYHQLGNLAYRRGDYETAEQRYQAALAIHAELGLADDGHDLRMLRKQRTALGDEQFQRILQTLLDTDSTATVMQLTETD
jgi:tetratricopeptide (TPR) repeat protein